MLMCGLTWLTIEKFTLKCKLSARRGMSVRREPSFHLLPKEKGMSSPDFVFIIRTTGLRIPGTAAEAIVADQITQSGAVMWFSRRDGLVKCKHK